MLACLPVSALLLAASPAAAPPPDLAQATAAWRERREKRLAADDGWLTLVALLWLKEGENSAGSAKDVAVVFPPKAPAHLGTFTRHGTSVSFQPAPGAVVTGTSGQPFTGGPLHSDAEEATDELRAGGLRFHVVVRGDRVGLRVKDPEAPARLQFKGIPTYPTDPRWRIEARWEPSAAGTAIPVPTVLGTVDRMPSPGTAVFTLDGKEYRLTPVLEEGEKDLFFIFADATNRTETYGAGRFLYADPPSNGRVILDFNRAYNPPCAFSPYATCPLPPKQNRLPVAVAAGERRYGQH
ncbi:MAG TPA: DUF1684 domain-containing protein [Myxococcaceae bacterium]|nr:DUF1684 domain-containing protein [Myxococcaceae bacterium]